MRQIERTPDMRLQALQEKVTRYLKQDVRDEEDDECNVILVADQAEFFGKTVDIGVRDVDSTESQYWSYAVGEVLTCTRLSRKASR